MKNQPLVVRITSNSFIIGHLSCESFRAGIDAPKSVSLKEAVDRWNEFKRSLGKPERASIVLAKES